MNDMNNTNKMKELKKACLDLQATCEQLNESMSRQMIQNTETRNRLAENLRMLNQLLTQTHTNEENK